MSEENKPTPRNTPHLLAHDAAERLVLEAWNSGRMAHAWLLAGPRGVGKATLAYRIARFVLAQAPADGGLFGAPPPADSLFLAPDNIVFHQVAAGSHTDLAVVERTRSPTTGKLRSEIVVADVRTVVTGLLRLTPGAGGWRVVIVDAADEMNRNAANALLKLLEEPPPRTLFLAVAHALGRVPPTLRSRCRPLRLKALPDEIVNRLLATHRPELAEAERGLVAQLADGSIGHALELIDAGGVELYRDLVALLRNLPDIDVPALHAFAERASVASETVDPFRTFARLVEDWLARLVRQHARGLPAGGVMAGEVGVATRLAGARPLAEWVAVWENVGRLFREAESANLDRKHAVISAFQCLATTGRN